LGTLEFSPLSRLPDRHHPAVPFLPGPIKEKTYVLPSSSLRPAACWAQSVLPIAILATALGMTGRAAARVTASSVHSEDYPAENALDGDPQTRWASRAQGKPEWLRVDFGRAVAVENIVVHWEAAYAVHYQIQISADGTHWQVLRDKTDGRGGKEVLGNLGGKGRYVRLLCLKPSGHNMYSVWEIEFPGKDTTQAIRESLGQAAEGRRLAEAEARARLSKNLADQGVREIVFAVRQPGRDGHWYANFGYYSTDEKHPVYGKDGKLCRLDLATGQVTTLLEDREGAVRDPVVHYDAQRILFSYRKNTTPYYHLYEINADGSGLRQLTDGPFDDIEPCYLPDGRIVFLSSRCKRWVNCWLTQVAVMHVCDGDGKNLRAISANVEHDNTPWPLPDGRILYQRWEYVDRSQVDYHHLWTSNPDGTGQMIYYGNQRPGTVMIDAKPIPNTEKVVAIFSPGHGMSEHAGTLTIVDPRKGPDDPQGARPVTRRGEFRDPWAFSEDTFMAAQGGSIVLIDAEGRTQEIFRLGPQEAGAGLQCHEPRPLVRRTRERIIPDRTNAGRDTGTLVLMDVYKGRNMAGVERGEIKKLLVLESLPKPINFTGGMDPLTYGGSFTMERVVGTVPVEPDGSACMELPALRALFFVALDKDDMAVKRMQSFLTVQPGERTSCVGCHEQRTETLMPRAGLAALARPPSRVEPIADCPDVFDFPRDIQPVLDKLCADCHGYEKTARGGPYAGKTILTGDRGPIFSHAYFTMTVKRLFVDNHNQPRSNYPPRALGSSASRILAMLDGSHYDVRATEQQKKRLRLWIEVGAPYPGTYAALGCGAVGGYIANGQVNTDDRWPTTVAGAEVIARRCDSCHRGANVLPKSLSDERGISFWSFSLSDPRLKLSRHIMFNMSRPEKSLLLLAPLAERAAGFGLCRDDQGAPREVFASTDDPDYRKLLAMIAAGSENLDKIKRFDMPGFRPRPQYLREMRRFGILPPDHADDSPVDPYALDRRYWESLWYVGR
jgi:hypothetical protein